MPKRKKGPTLEETTRTQIAEYLPDAVDHALESYRNFYKKTEFEDAKDFSSHHSACKAAIAHVELLLKLAAWAQLPRDDVDETLATLLADAEDELQRYNKDGEVKI